MGTTRPIEAKASAPISGCQKTGSRKDRKAFSDANRPIVMPGIRNSNTIVIEP